MSKWQTFVQIYSISEMVLFSEVSRQGRWQQQNIMQNCPGPTRRRFTKLSKAFLYLYASRSTEYFMSWNKYRDSRVIFLMGSTEFPKILEPMGILIISLIYMLILKG
jgi:hypothetical protein